MANGDKPAKSRGKATIEDVLLAVAETQRTMAEALLVQGRQAPATRQSRSAPAPQTQNQVTAQEIEALLVHRGVLVRRDDCQDKLALQEFEGGLMDLTDLADRGKWVQFTLKLMGNERSVTTLDENDTLLLLTDFLKRRAEAVELMNAQCPHQ